MTSEIVHYGQSNTNQNSGVAYLDRRASLVSGTTGTIQWKGLATGGYDTSPNLDDGQVAVNPVSISMPWSAAYSWLVTVNNPGRLRVAFDNPAVQGIVLLGKQSSALTYNTYIDGALQDAAFPTNGNGLTDWDYKSPIWAVKNGVGSITLTPGTHTFDVEYNATTSPTLYAACGWDGVVHPHRVLVIGDSYTNAFRSFVWHLRNLLFMHFPHSDLRLYSFAQSGRATGDTLAATVHGLNQLDMMLMAYSPTLVISTLGRNDANTSYTMYNASSNAGNSITYAWSTTDKTRMDSFLAKVNSYGAQMAWYNPANTGYNQTDYISGAREWAQLNNVPFRDAGLVIGGDTNLIQTTHPTCAGNELLGMDMFLWFVESFRHLI